MIDNSQRFRTDYFKLRRTPQHHILFSTHRKRLFVVVVVQERPSTSQTRERVELDQSSVKDPKYLGILSVVKFDGIYSEVAVLASLPLQPLRVWQLT